MLIQSVADRVLFIPPMGIRAQQSVLESNVLASVPWVAQWKFNNNGNDSIGANHLTANNSPTFTQGKLGGATGATQLVAASSQYWSIADNAALSMGDVDFTICLWFYMDSKAGSGTANTCVGKWNYVASQREYILFYNNNYGAPYTNDRFHFAVSINGTAIGGVVAATSIGSPSTGVWYLLVAWHDAVANTLNIQVNNGTVDSISYSLGVLNGTSEFDIGRYQSTDYFSGRIDNVCIAKSAAGGGGVLSASQRSAFFNAGSGTELLT